MNKLPHLTDEEIRINTLTQRYGWDYDDARRWVVSNQKPATYIEENAVLAYRLRELGRALISPVIDFIERRRR